MPAENRPSAPAPAPRPEGSEAWEAECAARLGDRPVVLGIGNRQRGDDGVGSVIAERLAARGVARCFDCGPAPENCLARAARLQPSAVLLIDAADCGAPAGSLRLLAGDEAVGGSPSTHSPGLALLAEYVTRSCGAPCYLLGVQPGALRDGERLSPDVRRAAEQVVASGIWDALLKPGPGATPARSDDA